MHAVMRIVFDAQSNGVGCGPLSIVVDNKLYRWHNITQHPRQKTPGKKKHEETIVNASWIYSILLEGTEHQMFHVNKKFLISKLSHYISLLG